MTDPDRFARHLDVVRAHIEDHGRRSVRIIAVTKGFGADAIDLARRHQVFDIGESYAQELQAKSDSIPDDVRVHFIGRIQRNKVRRIADRVVLWHSVARPEIVREIAARADAAEILIQVRPIDDPTKDGVSPAELPAMLAIAGELGVSVRGLMTIGVHGDPVATREVFAKTRALASEHALEELSMGMSDDYLLALEEGSTMLRLGTVLFGPRPSR